SATCGAPGRGSNGAEPPALCAHGCRLVRRLPRVLRALRDGHRMVGRRMNATGRSRLRPVPPAVLNGLQSGREPRRSSGPVEPRPAERPRLVGIDEARASHELASLLDPVPMDSDRALELLESEIRTM